MNLNNAGAAAQAPERGPSVVDINIDALQGRQFHTNDLLGTLERRLKSVLRAAPPAGDQAKAAEDLAEAELPQQLRTAVCRQEQLNERLGELIDRLVVG